MRKRTWIAALFLVAVLVVTLGATPIFADSPDGNEGTPAGEEAWQAMHEVCEEGDWEAMAEAAKELHGEDFDSMPCHGEDGYAPANYRGSMGGHMGGGMMGGW